MGNIAHPTLLRVVTVGRNELLTMFADTGPHDRIPSPSPARRHLLLHRLAGNRGQSTLTDHIGALRFAYARAVQEFPVTCHAMVVLPDHMHAVMTEPESGVFYSERWRRFKARFSHAVTDRGRDAAQYYRKARTRHLATPVLGTCHPDRSGLQRCPARLRGRCRQAWSGRNSAGLALFQLCQT